MQNIGSEVIFKKKLSGYTVSCTIDLLLFIATKVVSKKSYDVTVCAKICLQCFDAVGWAAGRASGL